jgi:hypothetical protein
MAHTSLYRAMHDFSDSLSSYCLLNFICWKPHHMSALRNVAAPSKAFPGMIEERHCIRLPTGSCILMDRCTPNALLHNHLSRTSTWVLGVQQALKRFPRTSIDSERFERHRNVWTMFTTRPRRRALHRLRHPSSTRITYEVRPDQQQQSGWLHRGPGIRGISIEG